MQMEERMKSRKREHPGQVTILLGAWSQGDEEALAKLISIVYDQLCTMASHQLRREPAGHTLDTSALVHEAYLRLTRQQRVQWQNRAHFYGIVAQLIRRVLVDHARRHLQAKRGGGRHNLVLDELGDLPEIRNEQVLAVDEALAELASFDLALAQLVELRFFAGLSIEEIASMLEVSERTISRRWQTARAWLYNFMGGKDA